jgi:uncharacterized protein (AIM24 family)
MERVQCQWCSVQGEPGAQSCTTCGAPLDIRDLVVTDSGWREAPRLRDLTEFRFSNSVCQVEGELVPVVEIVLARRDAVFFENHVLLWKDETTPLSEISFTGGLRRVLGGMPYVLYTARGPGRVAFSRDSPGELVVLPFHRRMELDVREHAFLAASDTIDYSFVRIKGLTNLLHGRNGMYLDRFVARARQGVLILHGNGNVFEKTLGAGEKILVEPGGFLYKDASVQMVTQRMDVRTGVFRRGMYLAEITGPGRVGIQSMHVRRLAK